MKKMAIAGLLAAVLSLTALSEQRAAAWGGGEFNFSIGVSISCNWQCQPRCQPCWQPCYTEYSCPSCNYDYAGSNGDYRAYAYPQAAPIAAPAAQYNVQNAGYTYPTGYGNYQAPSYWYGR